MRRLRLIACAGSIALLLCSCDRPTASPTPAARSQAPESSELPVSSGLPAPTGSPASPSPSSSTPPGAITGLTGRIVFARAGGTWGDETTFMANIDGSNEVQVGAAGSSSGPWAMADGSLLVVTTSEDDRLLGSVSRLDGSIPHLVPQPAGVQFGSGPFTPDGLGLVVEAFTAPGFKADHTYVVAIDGSTVDVLTNEHFITGDVSPLGGLVLLFTGPEAGPNEPPPPGRLWLVGIDGTNLHPLTPAKTSVQCCFGYRWSPDGSKIVFASPDGGLWTIGPDGGGLREVFHDTQGRWAITPTWSPDGSMILFGLDPTANPFAHPANGLYVIRADGTGLTLVLGGQDFKREPTWVPAGEPSAAEPPSA